MQMDLLLETADSQGADSVMTHVPKIANSFDYDSSFADGWACLTKVEDCGSWLNPVSFR